MSVTLYYIVVSGKLFTFKFLSLWRWSKIIILIYECNDDNILLLGYLHNILLGYLQYSSISKRYELLIIYLLTNHFLL